VAVSTVSLVTVGVLVGIQSLGYLFTDGFQRRIIPEVMTGVVMTFLVALLFDALSGGARPRHSPVVTRGSTASSGGCLMDLFSRP
jgi:ABC-type proline/glycine betaine transport system permease subunit